MMRLSSRQRLLGGALAVAVGIGLIDRLLSGGPRPAEAAPTAARAKPTMIFVLILIAEAGRRAARAQPDRLLCSSGQQ